MKIDAILAPDMMRQFDVLNQANGTNSAMRKGSRDWEMNPVDWNPEMLLKKYRELKPDQNMYYMLLFLNLSDKVPMLSMLTPKMLLWGVSLFPRELLLKYLMQLDKKVLIGLYLKRIRMQKFLSFFPKYALLNMLLSKEINMNQIMRGLVSAPVDELRKMTKRLTGKNTRTMDKPELLNELWGIPKPMLVKGMMQLSDKTVLAIASRLASVMPEIMERIPDYQLFKITSALPKEFMMRLMTGLEPENHVDLLSTLGDKDMSYVLTALDPEIFKTIMLTKFPDAIRAMSQQSGG